jgi:hypothetical protein
MSASAASTLSVLASVLARISGSASSSGSSAWMASVIWRETSLSQAWFGPMRTKKARSCAVSAAASEAMGRTVVDVESRQRECRGAWLRPWIGRGSGPIVAGGDC